MKTKKKTPRKHAKRLKTRFFHFSQNNSGGSFYYSEPKGITHHVIIEATDYNHANVLAEDIGLYFDGVSNGRDCSCCGDRWYKLDEFTKGSVSPALYDSDDEKYQVKSGFVPSYKWMDEGREVCVHYLDGKKEWF